MNVAVYAISKNESANAGRFMDSIEAAGLPVYVLDHSTDGTDELLRKRGAHVDTTPMDPFWFDAGKNAALSLLPTSVDVAINLDLDETLLPALADALKQFRPATTRLRYLYQPDSEIKRTRYDLRIHTRHGYSFKWPIHEYLMPDGIEENIQTINETLIVQHPSRTRKHTWTARLAEAVDKFPGDARLLMLYGRDLFFDGQFELSRAQLARFVCLRFPSNTTDFDKSYALALMARCAAKLGADEDELRYLTQANECAKRRESMVDLAAAYMRRKSYVKAYERAIKSLSITTGQFAPHCEPDAWSFKPFEIAMISAYNLGQIELAKQLGIDVLASAGEGEDRDRIAKNLQFIKETV